MIIKNLTSKIQKIEVREFTDDRRVYDIFLNPNKSTDLDGVYVTNPERYIGILDIEGYTQEKVVKDKSKTENPSDDRVTLEEKSASEGSEFVCDICHAEFASARGLNSHKNRVHPEE